MKKTDRIIIAVGGDIMKWIIFLLIIIAIKIIATKGLFLVFILLSFWLKGNSIKKSSAAWDDYFLTLKEQFVNGYVITLYGISTVLSSCAAYILFRIFGFQNPVSKTILLTVICVALSGLKYIKNGKKEIVKGLDKIHKAAFEGKKKNLAD